MKTTSICDPVPSRLVPYDAATTAPAIAQPAALDELDDVHYYELGPALLELLARDVRA